MVGVLVHPEPGYHFTFHEKVGSGPRGFCGGQETMAPRCRPIHPPNPSPRIVPFAASGGIRQGPLRTQWRNVTQDGGLLEQDTQKGY